jgi:arylsulfatase
MRYTFDDANAKSRRTTQYFEMMVNRGIYHDGWMACSHFGVPWETAGRKGDFATAPWELYNIDEDFSQADDLAAKEPAKLRQLQALFVEEARKYDVFPLDPRMAERLDPRNRVAGEPRMNWTYYGNKVRVPEPVGPVIFPYSHTITAELSVPEKNAEGVVACCGGGSGGWSLYVKDGHLTYHYNFFDFEHTTVTAASPLPAGKATVKAEFVPGEPGNAGTLKLSVNGHPAGEGRLGKVASRHGIEPFEVGRDSISPVSPDYKSKGSFPFTGTVERITFEAMPPKK